MDALFICWFATFHLVNAGLGLAVTRFSRGLAKTLIGFSVYLTATTLVSIWLNAGDGNMSRFGPLAFPACFGAWWIATMALAKGPLGRTFFAATLLGAHQLAAVRICLLLKRYVQPTELAMALSFVFVIGMGAFAAWWVMRRIHRLSSAIDWRSLNIMVTLLLLAVFVCGVWPISLPTKTWPETIPFVLVVLLLVSFFPVVFALSEKARVASRVKLLEGNLRILLARIAAVRAADDGARRVRHDMHHHAETLCGLLETGETASALRYVRNMISHELLLPPSGTRWCENVLVNALLAMGERQAGARGFAFHAEARVPETLKVSEPDLVALLGNLLENAAHGAAGGTVRASVAVNGGALRIGVSNAVPAGFVLHDGLPCESPGVGLFSVREVVRKYHGLFDYELADDVLTARVMIGGVA